MHSLLRRQLKQFFGNTETIPVELAGFVAAVEKAYQDFDTDRLMLERSLELSSAELLQSNADMRAIFEAFPDLYFRLDEEGTILDVKGGEVNLLMPPLVCLGKRFYQVPSAPAAVMLANAIRKVKETASRVRIEYPLIVREHECVFEARMIPILGKQIIVIVRNITERALAERALEASLSLQTATLESTADGILVVGRDGRVVNFNVKFLEMWGIPRSLIDSRDDGVLLSYVLGQLADPEGFLSKVRDLYEDANAASLDFIEFKDGRFFERYSQPQTVGVECVGRVWSFRDVTKERSSAEELARQRRFLRQVIDLMPNFVFAKDHDGKFTLVNQAVADAYGTTVENLIGKTDADFNSNPEEVEQFRRDDLEVMDKKKDKVILEEVLTDASGRVRYLQTTKRAIISPDSSAGQVLGVSTDITEHKHIEAHLRQSQKIEAVGRLAGGIAHDFNNLLTAILGYGEILLTRLVEGHADHQTVQEILKAGKRAASLTHQLLAFSRKQVLQPKILNLNALAADMEKMLRRLIGEDIELATKSDVGLGAVRADPSQIEQVIMNLVVNSRDAMPDGGMVTIETNNVTLDDTYASRHMGAKPGRYVMLAVSDTGTGMDVETQARVFEPFFTTKEQGKGTGLGLATVYGIVKQSQGYISLYSEAGHGTTFKIYLPRADEPTATEKIDEDAPLPRGTETILLVEDEQGIRRLGRLILEAQGYSVLEAPSGASALTTAEGHAEPIHLILTDVVMSGMNGRDLSERLIKARPSIKVLYMSGHTGDAIVRHGVLEPGIAFLQKPFSPADLARKVREVLDAPPPGSS